MVGQGLDHIYTTQGIELVAVDIYASEATTLVADGHRLPFADECFDAVVIQAVLEHVLTPQEVVAEICRVLRPGGLVFADTPFIQQVHGGAYDFTRFTVGGHRWLFRHFAMIEAGASLGAGSALIWSIRYFVRALTRSGMLATASALAFFWLRLFDGDSSYQRDAACGVYFYGVKSDEPLRPTEMITFYELQHSVPKKAWPTPEVSGGGL